MLFLILAILSSAAVSIVMRISSDKISANLSMLATNYLVCAILGACYAEFDLLAVNTTGFGISVLLGLVSGMLYLAGFVMLQKSIRKNGVVLSSMFMKLGLLVPIVMSVILFGEVPTLLQLRGFILAIGAIIVVNLKKDTEVKGFGMGLILLLFLGGGCDAMSKIYEVYGPVSLSQAYLCYTFFTAFLLCLGLTVLQKERPGARELIYGTLIGIPNFFSAKFLLGALSRLPAVVVYPSFSVATLLLITLTGVVVFKERLSKIQWLALAAIVAALILLNI